MPESKKISGVSKRDDQGKPLVSWIQQDGVTETTFHDTGVKVIRDSEGNGTIIFPDGSKESVEANTILTSSRGETAQTSQNPFIKRVSNALDGSTKSFLKDVRGRSKDMGDIGRQRS